MEFFELIRKRHAIRVFTGEPVSDGDLNKILEAANLAPSAGNLQAYEIVLVRSAESKAALAKAARDQDFIKSAPAVLVVCANSGMSSKSYGDRGEKLYAINDASIATAYIELAAADLGLGSVWVGAFRESDVARVIEAPEFLKPIAIVPIGHPAEMPMQRPRRLLDDLVHQEKIRGD